MKPLIVQQFLRKIARRQAVVSVARKWRFFLVLTLGLYAAGLLLSRLFGFLPAWFTPLTLAAVPAGALVLAWIFHQRPQATDAARLADTQMGTHDLFLTASVIEHSLGEYQDLVLSEAERRATTARPENIVSFRWGRDTVRLGVALVMLALGVYLLPQWDPLGLQRRQQQVAEQLERARELSKATEARAALLEQKQAGEQSEAVKQALANLEKVFQDAKPNDKAGTLARLNEQQRTLGELWKLTNEEKLRSGMNLPPAAQSFGLADPAKDEKLRTDLQNGDTSSANQELEELKQKAQELAATQDPVAREKLRQELMDRLQNFKNTLGGQLNSPSVDAALQRALEQLAMSSASGLSGECLSGMCDSLSLTQAELQQLARAMAEIKSLEEALKALQQARALHNLQPLDGQDFIKLGDLSAYAAFCQGRCESLVPGMGLGAGYGMGPRPYGDDSLDSAFHPEKAPSLLQPGRMLMEWKTREVSEAGPAREAYLRAVQDARQQASEAVVQEQIPPGYQAAIKRYFDTLHHDANATSAR